MTPWPVTGLRRVSVNSFGIGGSNAHVVLEDAYNYLRLRKLKASHATMMKPPIFHSRQISPVSRGPLNFFNDIESDLEMDEFGHIRANSDASSAMDIIAEDVAQPLNRLTKQKNGSLTSKVLIWSAADEGGLTRMIAAYHEYFLKMSFKNLDEGDYLEALSYTLGLRRSSFQWKTYAVAQSVSDLSNLTQLVSVPVRSNKKTGIGFIFTGQGSQYKGMGRDLLSFPVFAKTLRSIDSIFCTLGCKWSLLGTILLAFLPAYISHLINLSH
jgi:acyl transferase domain-containing protein